MNATVVGPALRYSTKAVGNTGRSPSPGIRIAALWGCAAVPKSISPGGFSGSTGLPWLSLGGRSVFRKIRNSNRRPEISLSTAFLSMKLLLGSVVPEKTYVIGTACTGDAMKIAMTIERSIVFIMVSGLLVAGVPSYGVPA